MQKNAALFINHRLNRAYHGLSPCLILVAAHDLLNQFASPNNAFTAGKTRDFHVPVFEHIHFYPLTYQGQRDKNHIFPVTTERVVSRGRLQIPQEAEQWLTQCIALS